MKIVLISSHTKSLFWFRMDLMDEIIRNGHTVIAVGSESEDKWASKFSSHGICYKQITVERNGFNVISDLKTFFNMIRFMRREKPDKVFAYQAKSIIYGSIAARLTGTNDIYILLAGLGSILRSEKKRHYIIKKILYLQYKIACYCSKKVFFQNNDDKNDFVNKNIINNDKVVIVNGSGVNIDRFQQAHFPKNIAFLFIGRLIRDKGIFEYLKACREIKIIYPNIECLLVGPFDSNPSAISEEDLKPYLENNIIQYFGEQQDVRKYIRRSSIFVLPSYHEGTPKTVIEAMAMGRPIITTNAPGCKETVENGVNGYLINIKDTSELVNKMKLFIENPQLIKELGDKSREIACEKYDVSKVNRVMISEMQLYGG